MSELLGRPLRTALGRHRIGELIRSGQVADPELEWEHVPVEPIHRAFAPMVREQNLDVCEMAIVTALQALAYGHPVTVLPVVLAARFQRGCLVAPAGRGEIGAAELRGARIGIRSYTQTTGLWIRIHLAEDLGLAADEAQWITQNPAHVPEYRDPAFVHRTLETSLVEALRSGEVEAAVFGNDLPEGDEFVPVLPDPAGRDRAWYAEHGYAPVNHVVTVPTSLLTEHPETVARVVGVLSDAEAIASEGSDPRITMAGVQALHRPLEEISAACLAQGMLPRPVSADEILAPVTALLT